MQKRWLRQRAENRESPTTAGSNESSCPILTSRAAIEAYEGRDPRVGRCSGSHPPGAARRFFMTATSQGIARKGTAVGSTSARSRRSVS